ncbi:membrane protein [Streptomyces sulfonofaciens]|uniref:Membrane protein n=1 Tax=Streptomyces sulfonofaciens TaxID=68272 RepID=A0A919GLQ7_9ACTN|nr:membrane protein [Streptomyces sulfonofaciens]
MPGPRTWLRDLVFGVRLARTGGREGWTRTLLTAFGVGLGVLLMLCAASVPSLLDARTAREEARQASNASSEVPASRSHHSFLHLDTSTVFRGDTVSGELIQPDGAQAPPPPGVRSIPGPGEMIVSPALRDLLHSAAGALLRDRIGYRDVGTVTQAGLAQPGELLYYAGSSSLSPDRGALRSDGYGHTAAEEPLNPMFLVLITLVCVVLLVPVIIFIATAVRFGGDRQDRRLAALRLLGVDARGVRRIASGESLVAAVCGLAVGAVLFAALRVYAGAFRLWGVSAFPSDVAPVPGLAVATLLAVPAAAVLATQIALRSVTAEPLSVARLAGTRSRRLAWRLVMPIVGTVLLLAVHTVSPKDSSMSPLPVAFGAACILIGLTGLLPWLVEVVVARLGAGPVSWQLAVRRLQLDSGFVTRPLTGVTVAVAGAIALQMALGGMQEQFRHLSGSPGSHARHADMTVYLPYADQRLVRRLSTGLEHTKGVTGVLGLTETYVSRSDAAAGMPALTSLTVADCATLRELAALPSCHDGDTFVARAPGHSAVNRQVTATAVPGGQLALGAGPDSGAHPRLWRLPASVPRVTSHPDPMGEYHHGVLATPGALDPKGLPAADTSVSITTDSRVADAAEYARNTVARTDPAARIVTLLKEDRDKQYTSVKTGILIASVATLAVIAASMLVSAVEQLRARRRMLSVLVAFGTRRRTLALSVLWQTGLPVVLGTALATAGGLGLGVLVLRVVAKPVQQWSAFVPFAATGALSVLVITLCTLPPLFRLMRPEGLQTE